MIKSGSICYISIHRIIITLLLFRGDGDNLLTMSATVFSSSSIAPQSKINHKDDIKAYQEDGITPVSAMDQIRKIVLFVLIAVGMVLLRAAIIMMAWNTTLPSIWPDNVPKVTFTQAVGLSLLSAVILR